MDRNNWHVSQLTRHISKRVENSLKCPKKNDQEVSEKKLEVFEKKLRNVKKRVRSVKKS